MRYIYTAIMMMLTPFFLFRLWWKGRKNVHYREKIAERFCLDPLPSLAVDVWLHAVSLGEIIAATPLIEQLLADKLQLLITSTTPTGAAYVEKHFSPRVWHRYLPVDIPYFLHRFFNAYRPQIGIIMETELWPNLIYEADKHQVLLILANARLSIRTYRRYRQLSFFFKPILNKFTHILAQSNDDETRFKLLGTVPERVKTWGNIKFDLTITKNGSQRFLPLKQRYGPDRIVIIAASTHEGEEQMILAAWPKLQKKIPNVLLLIAPRHFERFNIVYDLASAMGFHVGLQSRLTEITPKSSVIILDCLGELLNFYSLADFAFVGGSLVSVGGHNMLEPIALNVPVLTGPYLCNFRKISDDLIAAQGIELVNDGNALVARINFLIAKPEKKARLIANAYQVFKENQGVVEKYLQLIRPMLTKN